MTTRENNNERCDRVDRVTRTPLHEPTPEKASNTINANTITSHNMASHEMPSNKAALPRGSPPYNGIIDRLGHDRHQDDYDCHQDDCDCHHRHHLN